MDSGPAAVVPEELRVGDADSSARAFTHAATVGRLSPHRQIWLLAVLSFAALIAVAALAVIRTGGVNESLTRSLTGYLPAIRPLAEADTLNRVVGEGTIALASSTHGRVARLATIGGGLQQLPEVFGEYKRNSVHLPGEARLATDYQRRHTSYLSTVFQYVSAGTPAPPAAIASLRRSLVVQQADLASLRDLYLAKVDSTTVTAHGQASGASRQILFSAVVAGLAMLLAFVLVLRRSSLREQEMVRSENERLSETRRNDLETRLQRALEMVKSEEPAYKLVEEAINEITPGTYTELLVADSSRAHFRRVATTDRETPTPGCGVGSPTDCPAASRGQTQIFSSSRRLDACPHLRGRPTGECSGLCVPVSIAGKTVGVVHATGPDGKLPDLDTIETLELIARKTGEHVGMIRAFARSETQAQTDSLTGLLNRRSLEEQAYELIDADQTYVAVYGDLDHFKQLNDVYGHDAGDRALRLFSRVLRDSVRPKDLPARYGGEEFVVVLPDCDLIEATAVVERIQGRLAETLEGGTVPPFTASFGIAIWNGSDTLTQTIENADAGLLQAKAQGRNRWIIAGKKQLETPAVPVVDAELS